MVEGGASNSPLVNAVYAAEGTSLVTNLGTAGIGYINGDLTVALARLPVDEWIYLQADSHWTADGISTGGRRPCTTVSARSGRASSPP